MKKTGNFELDHVFILVAEGAPEADLLVDFGLTEGEPNIHPGQGTANRRFFFHNCMLELAYIHNPAETMQPPVRPIHFLERWEGRMLHTSPFGIILRPASQNTEILPFSGWHYKPVYLPDGVSFFVGDNSDKLDEPLVFFIPFGGRPDKSGKRQPLQHLCGFTEVSSLLIKTPYYHAMSATLQSVQQAGVSVEVSEQHLMEIGFDGEKRGKSVSFQPQLPLVLKW